MSHEVWEHQTTRFFGGAITNIPCQKHVRQVCQTMDYGQIIDSTCLDGHPSFYRLCSATIVMSDRLISGGTRSILIWILWILSEIPEMSQKSQLTQLIDGTHPTISRVSTIPSG